MYKGMGGRVKNLMCVRALASSLKLVCLLSIWKRLAYQRFHGCWKGIIDMIGHQSYWCHLDKNVWKKDEPCAKQKPGVPDTADRAIGSYLSNHWVHPIDMPEWDGEPWNRNIDHQLMSVSSQTSTNSIVRSCEIQGSK